MIYICGNIYWITSYGGIKAMAEKFRVRFCTILILGPCAFLLKCTKRTIFFKTNIIWSIHIIIWVAVCNCTFKISVHYPATGLSVIVEKRERGYTPLDNPFTSSALFHLSFLRQWPKLYSMIMQYLRSLTEKKFWQNHFGFSQILVIFRTLILKYIQRKK